MVFSTDVQVVLTTKHTSEKKKQNVQNVLIFNRRAYRKQRLHQTMCSKSLNGQWKSCSKTAMRWGSSQGSDEDTMIQHSISTYCICTRPHICTRTGSHTAIVQHYLNSENTIQSEHFFISINVAFELFANTKWINSKKIPMCQYKRKSNLCWQYEQ